MAFPDINTLEPLPGPFEIFELGNGNTRDLLITGWRLGRMTIHPRTTGLTKDIIALRVNVPEEIKALFPDYYDITSQTLIAQLLPILEAGEFEGKSFRITKYGSGPAARFALAVRPV